MFTSQDRKDRNALIWYILVGVAITIAVVLGIRIMFVVPNAAVGVVEKTLDPNNIVHKYEWFFNTAGAINARVAQLKAHKVLVEGETDAKEKQRLRIELVGQQQSCRDMVQSYNMTASKANVSIFKTDATPVSFSPSICE
jgi:type IV secretory pathway component VirB8